ncbi:MAG: acyltransferase family protein [Verrucomicrobiota bacterium]
MSPSARIHSLDQFRGYTVAAMLAVNFLGGYTAVPAVLRHHYTYCSYADIIMPQFFFAVGFSLRLVMLKAIKRSGRRSAYLRGVQRGFALILFGCLFYQLDGHFKTWESLKELGWSGFFAHSFRQSAFQALTHIGVTTLWVLPVIALSGRIRLGYLIASAGLHLALSHWFWYETLHEWRVIDGGLLGFLSWTIPTLAGALAYDWVRLSPGNTIRPLVLWGMALMVLGYALSCLSGGGHWDSPPFFPPAREVDLWTMSQRAGSVSYLVFASGFALATYAFFVWITDLRGRQSNLFSQLGRNAFAAYVIHMIILVCFGRFAPRDAPLWYAVTLSGFGCWLSYLMTCWCNRRELFLRL